MISHLFLFLIFYCLPFFLFSRFCSHQSSHSSLAPLAIFNSQDSTTYLLSLPFRTVRTTHLRRTHTQSETARTCRGYHDHHWHHGAGNRPRHALNQPEKFFLHLCVALSTVSKVLFNKLPRPTTRLTMP